ncbi:MAG TPA: DNA-binding protein [Gordonia sp. (in: high G+C Gram-positive bacteria)]|uniref:DNA-binding protein n=1 Tax=unclassified Gordonia (in: high G+C Gram-positive bacteria) TaxID=2657482 RepID=UPI0025C21AFA|nr:MULTISPECIES: DNA-binding protein [unclassified Gordonia (in: high G+C Gram-positive bacteria)]HNP57520.1 DNA-binding protein [Gordonia sp. (in: high G+C Gram-positive bacteria)]HRC51095.1 DNA-binding protein [Gordonia sp. (in: high G+C Gram-positive bacteria)]
MPRVEDAKRAAQAPLLPAMGTADEVAKVVRVTTAALAQDRYLGRGIPYVKHGKRVLYRWDDVRAYLDANRIDPGAA